FAEPLVDEPGDDDAAVEAELAAGQENPEDLGSSASAPASVVGGVSRTTVVGDSTGSWIETALAWVPPSSGVVEVSTEVSSASVEAPAAPDLACVSVIDQSCPYRVRRLVTAQSSSRTVMLLGQSCSSGSSALRAMATRVTPSGRSISLTPIVFRSRVRRTGFTGVRRTPPLEVMANNSSSGLITTAPTSPPRRSVILAVSTPFPPLPC